MLRTFMSAAKRMKSTKIIGTHSGTFHCDEALAVFLLRLTDEFKDADVVRTRDPAKLAPLDIVVDVGGEYDPARHRYDHHQRGFNEVFDAGKEAFDKIKLSSAGLVYKHFGKHIVANVTGYEESDPKVDMLWLQMYKEFVEAIDAIDNGFPLHDSPAAYSSRTDLSARVGQLNPRWNEEYNDTVLDAKFVTASALTGREFLDRLDYFQKAWLPARDIVAEGLSARESIDPSGSIVVFNQSVPWKDHLYKLEASTGNGQILYILYPESEDAKTAWRIQCVPESKDSFKSRKPMPEAWRGVRDADLAKVAGIEGCVFCHAAGFIGGNKTYGGALEMARRSVQA